MATEADVPEPISTTQRVGENIYLASEQSDKTIHETSPGELKKLQETHNLPCETAECSAEAENTQEADKVGAETINTVIKGNVEIPEDERFLESPSVALVDTEETCMISKHCQADEESFQEDKEKSENKNKMQDNTTNETAQETGSGENKIVEELEEKAENNNRSHDIVHLTGTSLQAAKIEESNLGNRGEGSLEDESYVDQHVEVIEDQQDSDEDKSTNKETRDMQKIEKDGDASLESNKQVLNTIEVMLNQNKETSIHIPDPGVISLNKDIETAAEPCNKAEGIKDKFTGEELGKTSSEVDDTEAEKSTNLVGEEESPEATRLSEREENEEDESSVHEAGPETGEKLKEVSSISSEGKNNNKIEPSERMDQTSPVEEEMNHKNNTDTCFAVQTEETCLQKMDNPELLKVVPRSWSDDIIKESPEEVKEKIEMIEKTAEGDTTSNEKGKDYENPEQKEESSSMKHEGTTGIIEVLAATDIPSGENRDEGGSTVVVAEDNTDGTKITDDLEHNQSVKSNRKERSDNVQQNEPKVEKLDESLSTVAQDFSIAASNKDLETITCDEKEAPIKSHEESFVERMIDASQQSQSGMPKHEEGPEQLQQNEPEKEKLDGSSNLVNEDFGTTASTECAATIPCAQEEAPIKSHKESFAEKVEEDLQTRSKPNIETGIPKDKNVPAIEMNEKIDDLEVHVLNKDANDLQVTYPSIEVAVQGKDLDFEPEGQTHEAYKASTEQKHIEDAPEVCQSSNSTISEHTSTETETVTSEPIPTTSETDMTKLQEACRLDSEENSINKDSGENKEDQEMKTNEEACQTVTHEILAKGDYAGKDMIDTEASVEVNRAIFLTDEMVEQKFHIESPLPAAPTLSGEDETYKLEDNAKTKLEELLPVISDDTEIFSSRADKIPWLMEGGAPPNLEETAHKEEKVNETEENNETKDEKIAKEEDLQLVAETSEASTESIVLEPKSERDKMAVEDDTQKEEPEELYKDSKTDGEGEDIEKQNTIEECVTPSILPEPIGEKSLKSFQEDKKEDGPKIEVYAEPELASAFEDAGRQLMAEENKVDQCKDLDVKETVQSSEEDDTATKLSKQDNDTCISVESIERETVESSQGNKYKAENSEDENSREQIIEEGLIPESIEQDPTKNLNDEIQKTGKSTGEILEISETAKAVESIAHETSETTEIPKEILDTFPVKHEENFLSEGKITEASLEEKKEEDISSVIVAEEKSNGNELVDAKEDTAKKPLENEADLDHILQKNESGEKLEQSLSMSDGIEIFSSNADESSCSMVERASETLEETAQTEENNEAKQDKIAIEEDLKVVSKTSDASKSIESIVLEPNSELDNIVVEDDTGKGESEEVHVEPETTSIGEDAEKHIITEESTVGQCRVTSEEDDKIANMSKQGVESIEQETVESPQCNINNAEESEAVNNTEYTTEDSNIRGLISETVEQDPTKNLNDKKMKAKKSSGEIFENSKTAEGVESSAHETLDVIDTSLEKQKDNLQSEGDNPTPTDTSPEEKETEAKSLLMVARENSSVNELLDAKDNIEKNPSISEEDLEHISQKNETGEKLDQSLSKMVDETESFSSNADKIPRLMEEGAPKNEEAARNEEETERNNEARDNKIAVEEDIEVVAEISNASKSEENIAMEPKSEMDKIVDGDDAKNGDSEELSEDSKDTGKGDDSEKQNIAEADHTTSILPEPIGEKALQSFAEEEKEEETPKIEIFENSETARAAESIAHETSETIESPKELLDTSPVKHKENLQSEGKTTETSLEEKNEDISPVMVADKNSNANELVNAKDEKKSSKSEDDLVHILQKNESEEKLEQSLPTMPDEIEILSSNANKNPCLMVEGASQNLEETAQIEDKTEVNDEAKHNKIVMEEDLKEVVKMSDASKSIESTVLEQESELDKMVIEDDTKKVESEGLYEDSKNASEDESNEKHNMKEECATTYILPEPTGANIHQSVKDEKDEETPEIKVRVEPDTTSIGEDAEKQIIMDENTVEQCRVLEAEKIEQNPEEDDKIVKSSKQDNVTYIPVESVEQETVESSQGSTDNAENSEADINKEYTIEDGNIRGLTPESVEQDPVKNLNDEKMKAEKSSGQIFENSKTAEAAESIAHETIETLDIIDTSLEKKRDNLQSEGDNLTPKEASPEEKDEDRSPVMAAQDNSSVNELLDAKDNIEKNPSKTEEDLEHISHKDEPGEKLDQSLSKTVDETEAFSANADKISRLMEEGASQNEDAARNEEETEQNNETKDNKIAVKEDLKVVAEISDASKSEENIALESKSEMDEIVDGDDIKNRDSDELSKDSKDTGKDEDTAKQNIVEACHATSILPETTGEKALRCFSEEEKEEETPKIEGGEITQTIYESEDTGKQNIEEGRVADSNIEVVIRETDEEDSLKNENGKQHEEEVDDSNLAVIEKIESTSSAKERDSETLKDRAESNVASHNLDVTKASEEETHPREIKEDLVEKSVLLSEASYEDSKEETKFNYLDSVSVSEVKEEVDLQEAEAKDRNRVESFGPVFEEKGIAETETREITFESGDMKVKPEDTSNVSEMVDKDIPVVADEDRIDKDLQNEVPRAGREDKEEVTTNIMPLKVEDELIEYSTMALEEHKLESSEARKTVDETPETIQAPDENEGTTFVAKEIDEILMQKHDKATNPLIVSESRSIDTEKQTANEVQKHKVDGLYVHPELENEKDLRRSKDVEILKREETKELNDQSDIGTSKTLQDVESSDLGLKMEETKDEKPFDEALKCTESTGTCTEIEKAIIEQEISEGNLHGGIEVEKAAIEQREEAYSQRHEDTSTNDDGTLTEEKSVDPDQKFKCASESVAEDPSKAILPESDKSKIEENDDNKKQQDEKEIEEKEEPTSDAEENKEQDANEITKVVIFTEKELGGVEQVDDIEDNKEPVIEKEQGRDELHALSTVGETTNQVKDSTLVCCSNANVAESKEKTDMENSEVEKDSTRKREASFARQSEEQKLQDESIETPAEELEEKKKEKILEESEDCCSKNDNATMPIMTAEKSSEQVDKLPKASNIDPEPCLETSETENSHQSKEIDIMKLEETSCDLTSNLPPVQNSHAEKDSITVENTETSACEETKIASEAFYNTKDQGTEETDIGTTVEKKDQVPSYDHDHAEKENATLENSDEDEVEETKIASAADQGAEGTSKIGKSPTVEGMDQVRSSNSEHAEKESRAMENPKPYDVNESKVSSDAIYMSKDHSTEESDGKTSNVEIPDQVPVTNSEHAKNESVTEENPDADDADETKMASNAVFKSEEKATKDIDEIRKSPTAEKQDAYKIEEASKVASDYRTHGGESLKEDEITTGQTMSTEQIEEPFPSLTSATTTTVEKIEEEEKTTKVDMLEDEGQEDSSVAKLTEDICLQKEVSRELDVSTLGLKINKDIQDRPTEVHEEECQNSDAALQLEPQEDNNNKIEHEASSSESKNTTDLTGQTETVCDLKFETSEKPLESEIVMHNHGLTESEDTEIKEKHLPAVITEMGDEEKQLKQTSEANEITQNEVSHGEITEEKEATKTHPVSLCEETTSVSLQEDELKAEECVEEETNTIYMNSANAIQNEELSVSTANKNIEEQVATEDRNVQDPEHVSVVNEIIKESFPNEFEAKDTEDTAIKLAPINQGEETNFESGKTETTTPRDEVDDSNPAVIEKIESASSAKETVSETLKDRAESNVASHHLDVTEASEEETHPREIKEDLVEKSFLSSEAFYEDSKEEIAEKEETKFNYSDSVSVTEVKEEADLQETEAEDRNQVESFGPVSEEKGIAETETREITLESGDMKVKPEDTSNVSEMMDKDIPVVADEDRIDKDLQNEVPRAGSEDQEEVTTNTMPLKVEDELIEYSTMASEEHKLKSSEARETVDETTEKIQAPDENEGTTFAAQEIDEILMQKHDKATNPLIVSESRSIDTEKETANEVQKHKVDGLYVHPELENEKDLRRLENVEILKREETKELTDQSDICTSKTLQDVESSDLGLKMEETKGEKPFDEALKCTESTSTCTEIEKAIIEQEISEGNLHGGIEVEKAAIEQKEEAYSQRHEDTSTKDDGTLTEENSKSEEQVATEDRSVQDPKEVSVVNEIIKESFPNEFEAKDTEDAAIKLAPINQGEEISFGSGKTETTTTRDDELGIETSKKESIKGSVNGSNLIEDIQELENNSCATTEKQIPTEAYLIGTPKTIVSTGNECAPSVLQEGITEVGDFEPGHASGTHLEAKGIKHEGEKITGDSAEETIEETAKIDTAKNSLSALLQTSKKETPQVAEHVTKERELTASPEELQTEDAENIQIREAKTGEEKDEEEEGEEHKKTDLSSDALVVVDVPRDMDVKVAHKKSHGILSGVGSKVKHSISKVKKAIIGKSSHHPKPVSPK